MQDFTMPAEMAAQPSMPGWAIALVLLISLAVYLFYAYCLVVISQKTGRGTSWWGWVPILNILLIIEIAGKPMWWIILYFIPLVNFIVGIIVIVNVCVARGKSGWLVIMLFIPIANFVFLPYLAFSE